MLIGFVLMVEDQQGILLGECPQLGCQLQPIQRRGLSFTPEIDRSFDIGDVDAGHVTRKGSDDRLNLARRTAPVF
jgi:hypothetical protein